MSPFKTSPDMENLCFIQVIDLRFRVKYIKSQKTQLFREHRNDHDKAHPNARLF